jgi:hypothetical protein
VSVQVPCRACVREERRFWIADRLETHARPTGGWARVGATGQGGVGGFSRSGCFTGVQRGVAEVLDGVVSEAGSVSSFLPKPPRSPEHLRERERDGLEPRSSNHCRVGLVC